MNLWCHFSSFGFSILCHFICLLHYISQGNISVHHIYFIARVTRCIRILQSFHHEYKYELEDVIGWHGSVYRFKWANHLHILTHRIVRTSSTTVVRRECDSRGRHGEQVPYFIFHTSCNTRMQCTQSQTLFNAEQYNLPKWQYIIIWYIIAS